LQTATAQAANFGAVANAQETQELETQELSQKRPWTIKSVTIDHQIGHHQIRETFFMARGQK
jgi:hypothetical protein